MAKSSGMGSLLMYGAVGAGVYYFLVKPMLADASDGSGGFPSWPWASGGGVTTPTTPIPTQTPVDQTAAPAVLPRTREQQGLPPLPTTPTTPTVTVPPAGFAPMDAPAGSAAPNFSQYIANTLGAGRHSLSADAWNWHFSNWSKVPQTADLFPVGDRGALMSLTDYMNRRTQAGLSGLGGPRALYGGGHTMPGIRPRRNPGGNYVMTNNRPSPLGIRR